MYRHPTRQLLGSMLALTAALGLALALLVLSSERAQAHTSPLENLEAAADTLASTIGGGSTPAEGDIVALGQAAMSVNVDAPNHPECPTMGSLASSALDLYEALHDLYFNGATAATYMMHLAALEAIASEAADLVTQKQTPAPEPTPEDTPTSGTPDDPPSGTPDDPPATPTTTTPPANPPGGNGGGSGTGGGDAPGAAETGSGGLSSSEAGLGLFALGALIAATIAAGGRLATRRRRH